MKFSISMLAGAILFAGVMEGAIAACTGATQVVDTSTNTTALYDFLKNNTVCVSNGSAKWENQEEHTTEVSTSGGWVLKDYKEGPGPGVDPEKQVGTWNVSGTDANTKVNYIYTDASGTSPTYSFTVHNNSGGSISFCDAVDGPEKVAATLVTGITGGCGTPP